MTKKTPLYDFHVKHKGKMVEFGGYLLPVNYETGIIAEHHKVRTEAGLFDVSHMAEIHLIADNLIPYLNDLLSNDFTTIKPGQIKYTLMLNDQGGVVDDLLVYYDNGHAMLVCNASNHKKALAWIKERVPKEVQVVDYSHETGLVSLQGPLSQEIIQSFMAKEDIPEKPFTFKENVDFDGHQVLISRTGYTGEDGFEIYAKADEIEAIANKLLETNKVTLCGLGCRDTLRLEAGLPLYGHELNEDITPYEANLMFFTKMNKEYFIGQEALKNHQPNRTRIGLQMIDRGIARQGAKIYVDDVEVGEVTSGTQLPSLGYAGAMAFIDPQYSELDQEVIVDVRGRKLKAKVIKYPFYSRKKEEK